ncbi:MAG: response regulator [Gemmatimonadota bacterium]|nr:response regulator [Gemmatimonadota bacterium]
MPDTLLRVLVVDDNRDNADIIRQYLESTREYVVDVAYGGDEALKAFREARPDLVLLDVMMPPGPNGWDVCRIMKSETDHAAPTRVIMVTARDDLADKRTALQTGADDFLEKPLDLSKLMSAVRRNAATLSARSGAGNTTGSAGSRRRVNQA